MDEVFEAREGGQLQASSVVRRGCGRRERGPIRINLRMDELFDTREGGQLWASSVVRRGCGRRKRGPCLSSRNKLLLPE
jgi:hypothetical protein